MFSTFGLLLQSATYIAVCVGVVWVYRWISALSRWSGVVFAAGVIIRGLMGACLFAISEFHLPLFRSLQIGGGFWTLAVDARSYFEWAAAGVSGGIGSISWSAPSPTFIRVLALWMQLVGTAPASGALLNLVCYACTAGLITAAARGSRAGTIALGAVTCSPALLVFGTQPLKDTLCVLVLAAAIAGVWLWFKDRRPFSTIRAAALGLLCAAVYVIAGIRTYVAFTLIGAFVIVAVVVLGRQFRRSNRWSISLIDLSGILVMWVALAAGGGPYFQSYVDWLLPSVKSPRAAVAMFDKLRLGFVRTPGATAIVSATVDEAPELTTDFDTVRGVFGRASRTLMGLSVMFVPISLLKLTSLVHFAGGRGLLFITDIDTLVMDVVLIGGLYVWMSEARVAGNRIPVLVFILVLAFTLTSMMAYVVTNFGTLFRLRLLAVTPLWLLPAFAVRNPEELQR